MAGSRTWRAYTADSGVIYSVNVDKSNSNAAVTGGSGGAALLPVRTANAAQLPRGVKMRYVLTYNQANPAQHRKFYVGTQAGALALANGSSITGEDYPGSGDTPGSNVTWIVTAYRGEKARLPAAFTSPDTGLTDGTTSA